MEIRKNTSYLDFFHAFSKMGCFSLPQVRMWDAGFNRNNLGRWVQESKIIHLRQGLYAFSECREGSDAPLCFAEKIYPPSYISLHSALFFYGMIPEGVVQITSVTARKTAFFENGLGQFSYRSMKPELIFGYTKEISRIHPFYAIYIAFPEKALLDLLYLYPQYQSEQDLQELRLDADFMTEEFNWARMDDFTQRFHSKSLEKRVKILAKGIIR